MSSCTSVTKNFKVEEEVEAPPSPPPTKKSVANNPKQGILTILGSDNYSERSKAASIRRTLSADMSSKKWLSQNGFASPPAMKKIVSSDELAAAATEDHHSSSSEGEEDEVKRRPFDVWSSILQSQKPVNSSELPPPYIHPLVKKSATSLTGKSLEICTESLGSETGSDCFSSYPPSESGDSADDDKDDHQSPQQQELIFPQFPEEFRAVKCSYSKKSPPRSFPPPLPSLVRGDKPSVRMHSRRQDGRLILEAVSVPAHNCFRSERQEGRLVLTFVNNPCHEETEDRVADKVFEEMQDVEDSTNIDDDGYEQEEEEEEEEAEEEKEMRIVFEKSSKLLINLNSFIGLESNKNKFNRPAVNLVEEVDDHTPLPQPLGPRPRLIQVPRPATAASFNTYEYFWKKKPTIATLVHIPTIADQQYYNKVVTKSPKAETYEGQDSLVLIRGRNRANNLILPMLRSCKEPRMSLLLWEPYCVATS